MRLVIVGAGGHGRETLEIVRALPEESKPEVIGFFDDGMELIGTRVNGIQVLGEVAAASDHEDAMVVVTTGSPSNFTSRQQIVERLGLPDERYAILIHPTAVVSESASIGAGSIIHAGVVATADVSLGRHVVVMPQTVLTHDDSVGDYATFGAGVLVAGRVTIEDGAYLGAGSMLREDIRIGNGALVGMGSVVTRDVPAGELWVGNPARRIR